MNTNDEQQEWKKKLSAAGFAVDGIDLTDAAVMMEIYKTLGLNTDNVPVKTRVRSFIEAARSFDMKEQMKELTKSQLDVQHHVKELVKEQANAKEELVTAQANAKEEVKEFMKEFTKEILKAQANAKEELVTAQANAKEEVNEFMKEILKAQSNAKEELTKSQLDLQHQVKELVKAQANFKEEVKELVEILRAEKTDEKPMSKASSQWAQELVGAMNITVEEKEPNNDTVLNTKEPPGYDWRATSVAGETIKIGEHQGTPGARQWFQSHFLPGDQSELKGYAFKVVTNHALPKLKAGGKSCSGKGDMVIGKESHMDLALDVYAQVPGLIELKTEEYDIRFGQIILELTAFSQASRFGRGAVLLVSDCNASWGLAWFENYNTIWWRRYSSARKCWMDFKEKLLNAGERAKSIKPPTRERLALLKEGDGNDDDDQNLDGFEDEPDRKRAAVENEAYLNQLANYLGEMYGERPVVPEWAKAKNIVPDYYA